MLNQEVGILTYCHKCQAVYTGQTEECLGCGEHDQLVWFVSGVSIRSWLACEEAYYKVIEKQCGCCDDIIAECSA